MADGAIEVCLTIFPCRSIGPFTSVTRKRAHMRAGPERPCLLNPSGIAQHMAPQKNLNVNIRGVQKLQTEAREILISSDGIPRRSELFREARVPSGLLISSEMDGHGRPACFSRLPVLRHS